MWAFKFKPRLVCAALLMPESMGPISKVHRKAMCTDTQTHMEQKTPPGLEFGMVDIAGTAVVNVQSHGYACGHQTRRLTNSSD